jgi:hypothetical protein
VPPPAGPKKSLPPPCRWQLSAEGFPIGPHDEKWIIEAIERGDILMGLARPAGELRWRKLKEHPPFAEALRRAASTASIKPYRSSEGKLKKPGQPR